VLGWFAHNTMNEQQAQVRSQFLALLTDRVDQTARGIGSSITTIENNLRQDLLTISSPQDLAVLVRHSELGVCGFWLNPQGRLLFPDSSSSLSSEEVAFVKRTRTLWSAKAKLDLSGSSETQAAQILNQDSSTIGSNLIALSRTRESGWVPWFWEDGLHLLYWMRGPQGSVIGIEVDRIALLAHIIGDLPEKDPGQGAFILLDETGRILHRFGGFKIPASSIALAEKSLPAPLQGWKLAYHGPVAEWETNFVRSEQITLLFKLSGLAMLLILVALWFWRESTRSLREARQRVDFVNQVSHELKTPLTNIRLYAELLESEMEDPAQQDKLRVIRSESERLSRMILNILTFSRKERRKLTLSLQPISLEEVVAEVVEHFSLSMEKRGLHAVVAGHAPREIALDRDAAGQIIGNLLSNAEKYAAKGQVVTLTLRQNATETEVVVADQGAGIPAHLHGKVFEPFYRVSNQLSEGVSGTGIGLSIARTLAEMMDGTLNLAPSDRGAQFTWRIKK
jgi:signal transduction histidine kinase